MTQGLYDYVYAALYHAGFENPTDENVHQIYIAAQQGASVAGTHPRVIVDALVEVVRAYVAQAIQDCARAINAHLSARFTL